MSIFLPIVYFLLLLIPLVFFHELGHFLVARWMGVRVLSFSIGFGPVLFEWHRNGTQYAVRALPLGGYVKMLGEGEQEEESLAPDEPPPPDSFAAKAVWRRALIVAAGPVANLILPIVLLFTGSLVLHDQVVSSRVGSVIPGGPAARAGLRAGDLIVAVQGEPISHFEDLLRVVSARPGQKVSLTYLRDDTRHTVDLTTDSVINPSLTRFGIFSAVGRIQVRPSGQQPVVAIDPDTPAALAGLHSGDLVLSVDGSPVKTFWELRRRLKSKAGQSVSLQVRPSWTSPAQAPRTVKLALPRSGQTVVRPAESVIGEVPTKSAAALAGLRSGDEVLSVDGKPVTSLLALSMNIRTKVDRARAALMAEGMSGPTLADGLRGRLKEPMKFAVRRRTEAGFEALTLALTPTVAVDRKSQQPYVRTGLRVAQRYVAPERIQNPSRMTFALQHTRKKMVEGVEGIATMVAGLFTGSVPMKELGGPLMIADLATTTAERGWEHFFELMVMFSINLAIINLLPIPVVDGGQLLFLAIEAVKRAPLSLKTRMIASYVGVAFLVFVFVVVTKNDAERKVASWVTEK